ncbi:transketolase [candidate division WOR-3 bacterium]|nr:transketolase [candidate division WOR-3 bacterium]
MNKRSSRITRLETLSRLCRGDIVKMTTIAGSGHPAGSMSSIDIYLAVYTIARVSPETRDDPRRDRVVISHGHTSPGLYSCLARLKYFDVHDVVTTFRRADSPFEGHVVRNIPGIDWSTGNLGQGLSAGCGCALASRLRGYGYHTYVLMSDAEQAKGQVAEARRFADKYGLHDLTVVIDRNHFQISGRTEQVMPVNIKENYEADGWKVLEVSGHDFKMLIDALTAAQADQDHPYAIIAQTTMGHGVPFMENKEDYHGKVLSREECTRALAELDIEDDIDQLLKERTTRAVAPFVRTSIDYPGIKVGTPRLYSEKTHPRAAFGNALIDVAMLNPEGMIAVFDCDLAGSVKVQDFARKNPTCFFECGVSEHNAATMTGALSINGVASIWADFGVFALDEVYNQMRLNDINSTNCKIIATHLGYNVGPDGKTHQCIDYIGLLQNLFDFKLIIPADPNQADHVTRYILKQPGNFVVGLTRSKLPVVRYDSGGVLFDENYKYTYGTIDLIREGSDGVVLTYGSMVHEAMKAWEILKKAGITVRIYNVCSPLHLDKDIILEAAETGCIVTYEDHVVQSGLGGICADIIAENNVSVKFKKVGIQRYGGSADAEMLYTQAGIDAQGFVTVINDMIRTRSL